MNVGDDDGKDEEEEANREGKGGSYLSIRGGRALLSPVKRDVLCSAIIIVAIVFLPPPISRGGEERQ